MCKNIEKIFNSKILITIFNEQSPNFRRNLDLFTVLATQVGVEAT